LRSQNSFIKKQKAEKKRKKRLEKIQKKIDKKNQDTDGSLDNMMAYLDDDGNIIPEKEESPEVENNKLFTNTNKNEKRNS
jgi:hypothetical protein